MKWKYNADITEGSLRERISRTTSASRASGLAKSRRFDAARRSSDSDSDLDSLENYK